MLRKSAAMFISPRQFCCCVAGILVTGLLAGSMTVDALATAIVDQSDHREAGRPDGDGERKLLADLVRVQSAAAEDFDLGQFDNDMAAAFRAYGLDLDRVDSKEARARLAGWRSTAEIVAAIDDWCNVRRRELGTLSWRRLADMARAIDTDAWRTALRDQFDRPPEAAIAVLRARAADVKEMERQPARSLVLLVRMLWDAGEPGTAMPVLNVAERRFPDDFWVCLELGNLGMVDEPVPDPAEAARYFSRAIKLKPRSYAAHENLANALVDEVQFDGAIAEFRVAIKLKPGNPDTYQNLGEALLLQGKTSEAIATLELAIRIRPELYDAHFALGVALGSQGRQDDAIVAFREAIRLNPELIDAQENVRIDQGREGALAAFREAIRNLPRPVAVRPALMVKVVNNQKARPGGAYREEGIRLDPQAAGRIERGYVWITKGDFDKASTELSEAIRLEPGCSVAYIHRAFASCGKREYGKAIADYDKAIALDPQNAAAYNDRAWLRATCPVAEYRDGTKALESAIWACALSGWTSAHPLGTLAAAYAEASDFASAVKCQTKAIKLLPAGPEKKDFGARLELYQARKAYHQSPLD